MGKPVHSRVQNIKSAEKDKTTEESTFLQSNALSLWSLASTAIAIVLPFESDEAISREHQSDVSRVKRNTKLTTSTFPQ